jgi:hypothetical protein
VIDTSCSYISWAPCRFGSQNLTTKISEIFGPRSASKIAQGIEGGDISFPEYLDAVEKVQLEIFAKSARANPMAMKTAVEQLRKLYK